MRVAVADDSLLFREGLVRLMDDIGFEVVGDAPSGDELIDQLAELNPDVVLTDIRMPPTFTNEGIATAHKIRELFPDVGVVVLSHHLDSKFALSLLADHPGGRGYLLKDRVADLDAFVAAVERVSKGETVVDPEVVAALVAPGPKDEALADLTARELEVLTLMAEGLSNGRIGDKLFLSPRTVESHVRGIFNKLGLSDDEDQNRRVIAVLTYLREHA